MNFQRFVKKNKRDTCAGNVLQLALDDALVATYSGQYTLMYKYNNTTRWCRHRSCLLRINKVEHLLYQRISSLVLVYHLIKTCNKNPSIISPNRYLTMIQNEFYYILNQYYLSPQVMHVGSTYFCSYLWREKRFLLQKPSKSIFVQVSDMIDRSNLSDV